MKRSRIHNKVNGKNTFLKAKRIDWKGKVEELNLIVELQKDKSDSEHKQYVKQYDELKKDKNFWLWILFGLVVLTTFVILVLNNRMADKDVQIVLLSEANHYAVDSLRTCRAELSYVTGLYNKGYYEVINSADLTDTFFDCCWPSNCAESVNNPVDCKCEYLLMCTESNLWGQENKYE
jgi:hypothetical protein